VKTSGLGDNLYLNGFDLSGDIQSLSKISGGPAALDVTGINSSAFERIGGLRDGNIDATAYFNPGLAANAAHTVLSALPTTDVTLCYARGTTLGNPAACMVAKQINYDGTRATGGVFTFAVAAQANGFGLEWGTQLTAGLRTDSAATAPATGVDFTASTSFGFQAYLQVTAFSGTDVTIKLRDSANNSTFADLAGGAFTAVTSGPQTQRIAVGGTATVREFVQVATTTSGGFTSVTFNVVLIKNSTAVVF
jgi:hypothetical protein